MKNKKKGKKISVVNLDTAQADYFLQFWADQKWGYTTNQELKTNNSEIKTVVAQDISLESNGSHFRIDDNLVNLNLVGLFNVSNALAAICVARSLEIESSAIKSGLERVKMIPGRLEEIDGKQNFKVIVDYAHEPKSLESVYQALKPTVLGKVIAVLGSCGGGRDKARRPILGQLAASYADVVIVTNEDPYDEDPQVIIDQVAEGAMTKGKVLNKDLFKILDRKEAITKALGLARKDDLVIITGKGSEQCIVGKSGCKIPWDDRQIVKNALKSAQIAD
jgi:UDP-N-acetylmuramyl-tripeptide synthetase